MASIEHNLPALVKMREKALFGYERPGVEIVRGASGDSRVRTWSDHELLTYEISPDYLAAEADGLRDLKAFVQNIGTNGPFWLVEPIQGDHLGMVCGPLGDNSLKCFPFPINGTPSDSLVFIDGALQSTGYTVHNSANLLGDSHADPTAFNVVDSGCTAYDQENFSLAGSSCLRVDPAGDASTCTIHASLSGLPVAVVGDVLTVIVAVYEAKSAARNYSAGIQWLNGSYTPLSTSAATPASAVYGAWTVFTHTATAPASTAFARPVVEEAVNTSTEDFYVDTFALCPATYDRWHLPSACPGVIEFTTAPAVGERVTANATGTRAARVRSLSDKSSWTMIKPGHATPSRMTLVEALEF